ncbi:uncharacterized protein [Dysidea avara]|uniref:uncharacterized protein isoform X3 n=1 Tax=Dysidea avara TaxID=196820 RepID=UPI003332B1EF
MKRYLDYLLPECLCFLLLATVAIETLSASTAPSCSSHTVSSTVMINSQQELIDSLTAGVVYSQLNCVIFSVSSITDHYTVDLTQLLALQVNFVIMSAALQHVVFECVDMGNMPVPLSGLDYVGFYRLSFRNCKIPLWIENVTSVVMEDVRFSNSVEGAVNIYNCPNVNVVNCTFEHNNSTGQFSRDRFQGSSGGLSIGFYDGRESPATDNITILVDSCRFISNNSTALGSDVHTATNLLRTNIVTGRGGGMSITLNTGLAVYSTVINNYYESNWGSVYSGGLYFLIRDATQSQTYLFKNNYYLKNQAGTTTGGMLYGLVGTVRLGSTVFVNVTDDYYQENSAPLAGAVRFQRPTGNRGNFLTYTNCTFVKNTAKESGAAIGISKSQFFNFDQQSVPISIVNCTFTENFGANGGTVFSAYSPVAFHGTNVLTKNRGPAIRALSSTLLFYGHVEFDGNNVEKYDGGALYLNSLSQMVLHSGAFLNFVNNTGSFGAGIVVEAPNRFSLSIGRTTNLCFMQYEKQFVPPRAWTNVGINFTGNKAMVGSVVYINRPEHCLSSSLSSADKLLSYWPFVNYSNNTNTGHVNKTDPQFNVQTPLVNFDVIDKTVRTFPGRNVSIRVKAHDLSGLPAAGILKFSSQDRFLGLNPSAIIVKPIDQSYNFIYEISTQVFHSFSSNFSVRQIIKLMTSAESDMHYVTINGIACPPGYVLNDHVCECNKNDEFIIDCFDNFTAIVLRLGLWAHAVDGRLEYYQCPHGYCQCIELEQNGRSHCSSVYYYEQQDSQCNCNRKGVLCGQCTNGTGMTVLLDKCDQCSSTYSILIGAVVIFGVIVGILLLILSISLPSWMYPFLFYIQITGYVTDSYQTSFSFIQQTNLYISSALSLYFPYDFCLSSGMTAIMTYALRYIPLLTIISILLVVSVIKRFYRKWRKTSWDGVWTLVMLTFSHLVYTSISILHCPSLEDDDGNKKLVWFVDGTVECFTGSHAGLAAVAIIVLVFAVLLVILIVAVSLRLIKRRWAFNFSEVLTAPFKEGYRWWTAVELTRRYVIIFFIIAVPGNHVPTILLLMCCVLLFGYMQPFKRNLVNILEFVFLVDFLLLQMIKSTDDIQAADILNVVQYRSSCGDIIKIPQFAFTLMILLNYLPVLIILLLIIICACMRLKHYYAKFIPMSPKQFNDFSWSYANAPTATMSSYFFITDDGAELVPQSNEF